jgi:Chlorophyll A-B binding protein
MLICLTTAAGFDPLRLSKDGINEQWALSELKHGRLAMIAMFAFLIQQLVSPDKSILDQTFEWARSFG